MSNVQFPQVSFAGLETYTAYEGGRGMVPCEGLYQLRVTKVTPRMSKGGDKAMLEVSGVVVDADAEGVPLIGNAIYSGYDSKNNPLNRQLADLLISAGRTEDEIRAWAKSGQTFDPNSMAQSLVGVVVHIEALYNVTPAGRTSTTIANWVKPERYAQAKESNAGLRGRTQEAFEQAQARSAQGGVAPSGGTAAMPQLAFGGPQAAFAGPKPAAPGATPFGAPPAAAPAGAPFGVPPLAGPGLGNI